MKKMGSPLVDDNDILLKLADNHNLHKTSYPYLRNKLNLIQQQYLHYDDKAGNALEILGATITPRLKSGLHSNYKSPPKELDFIDKLRESSPDICPMCGSFHSSTLDHLLPKEDYPEWSVFSRNLVPACQCNSKRGRILKGNAAQNERVLHPYYDEVLSQRNVSCRILTNDNYRLITIDIICIAPNGPNFNAIKYHINKVVKRAGIVKWLEKQWPKIRHEPSCILQTLDGTLNNLAELRALLEKLLYRLDTRHGTPNNWDSIFVHGILNSPGVIDWLFNHHNRIILGEINTQDG